MMKITEVTRYVAGDGTEYPTRAAAVQHEEARAFQSWLEMEFHAYGRINASSEEVARGVLQHYELTPRSAGAPTRAALISVLQRARYIFEAYDGVSDAHERLLDDYRALNLPADGEEPV